MYPMDPPDILLYLGPCSSANAGEELRYALRTWEKNLVFDRLCVVGGPLPTWFHPDIYIPNPLRYPQMRQCYDNLMKALSDRRLHQELIIMMDDIFLLSDWGDGHINHNRGTLDEQISSIEAKYGRSPYTEMLRATNKALKYSGFSAPLSFEEHAPFSCQRTTLLHMLKQNDAHLMSNLLFRSLYGNIYKLPTKFRQDVKYILATDKIKSSDIIVSTNEKSFSGSVGTTLKEWFPKPSRYEY